VRTVNDRLLTTRQVAEWLGFSPETVLRRYRAGELVGIRLGSTCSGSGSRTWRRSSRPGRRPRKVGCGR